MASRILLGVGPDTSGRRGGTDLTGFTSGRLTIKGIHGKKIFDSGSQVFMWRADCSCGRRDLIVNGQHFMGGGILSCGCLCKEKTAESKRFNRVRRDGSTKELPDPVRLSLEDLMSRKSGFCDLRGRPADELTILSPSHATLYWCVSKRNGRLQKHLVVFWNCTCSCGVHVVKSSNYLRRKVHKACHKCVRDRERNQAEIVSYR